jgi:hypothetical protein
MSLLEKCARAGGKAVWDAGPFLIHPEMEAIFARAVIRTLAENVSEEMGKAAWDAYDGSHADDTYGAMEDGIRSALLSILEGKK